MEKGTKKKVKVMCYGTVTVTTGPKEGCCIGVKVPLEDDFEGGKRTKLALYPEESKKLRKALKKAEQDLATGVLY